MEQQVLTLNEDELERIASTISESLMQRVYAGLRWFLKLEL